MMDDFPDEWLPRKTMHGLAPHVTAERLKVKWYFPAACENRAYASAACFSKTLSEIWSSILRSFRVLRGRRGAGLERGGDAPFEIVFVQGREHGVERAFDHAVEGIQRKIDAVVGKAVLGEIVGAYAF